jgi:hypothetical protein
MADEVDKDTQESLEQAKFEKQVADGKYKPPQGK